MKEGGVSLMPASSDSPIATEEFAKGSFSFWLSYKLTTPRRNYSRSISASEAGQADHCEH
jgi:hypothetical protein